MSGRLQVAFEDRGEQQLKNIARPDRVYEVGTKAIGGLPATPDGASEDSRKNGLARWLGRLLTPTLPTKSLRWLVLLPVVVALAGIGAWQGTKRSQTPPRLEAAHHSRGPTIAGHPFDNLSGDPNQQFFSDGISHERMTALNRFHHLRALARHTT